MPLDTFNRIVLFVAGLLGAAGVAAAAGAAHAGGALLAPLSLVALTHAPVLVAFGLSPVKAAGLRAGAVVVGAGALVFCGDLAARHLSGTPAFPYAAPIGGTAMIAGWAVLGVIALLLPKPRPAPPAAD